MGMDVGLPLGRATDGLIVEVLVPGCAIVVKNVFPLVATTEGLVSCGLVLTEKLCRCLQVCVEWNAELRETMDREDGGVCVDSRFCALERNEP